jgi:hypothetical protein
MNLITRTAVDRARGGNWELLDALEIVARHRENPCAIGILHRPGSECWVGYARGPGDSSDEVCGFCEGDGEVDVVGANGRTRYIDCPECDGSGGEDSGTGALTADDVARWKTLSGEPVEPVEGIMPRGFVTVTAAKKIIADAEEAMQA